MISKDKRRITITLNTNQYRNLQMLMSEDEQTNLTYYFIFLIQQEKKRREEEMVNRKKPVGRPKKETEEEDTNLYPAPYSGGGAYTKNDWIAWYEFRGQDVPPLPAPLNAEELKKYE